MYGRQPNFSLDNALLHKTSLNLDHDSYRYFLSTTIKETQKVVLENIKVAQSKQKKYYEKN